MICLLLVRNIEGQVCVPSLSFDLRTKYGRGNIDSGTSFKRSKAGREHAPPFNRKMDSRFTEHGQALQNKTQIPPQAVSPIRKLP